MKRVTWLAAAVLAACASKTFPGNGGDGGMGEGESEAEGAGQCDSRLHLTQCNGQVVQQCGNDGAWHDVMTCPQSAPCQNGLCYDPCASAGRSYVGCEYFAVDLPNITNTDPPAVSPADQTFSVVIAQSGSEEPVGVHIYKKDGDREVLQMDGSVPANTAQVFALPNRDAPGPGVSRTAWHIRADAPVTAFQFNPSNNATEAFSNDASLLLPATALDAEYYAVSGDGVIGGMPPNTAPWGAFVVVVGVLDDDATPSGQGTVVRLTPTAALLAGSPMMATLHKYDVLTIMSDPPDGVTLGQANLSGTHVIADGPVAAFSGNVSTLVPTDGIDATTGQPACCTDHLEEQLLPLSAWGTDVVAARSAVQRTTGTPEDNVWVIVGGADGVSLTYTPSRPTGAPTTLGAGQAAQFRHNADFIVHGSGPFMLTQFLESSQNIGSPPQIQQACFSGDGDCAGLGYPAACRMDPASGFGACVPYPCAADMDCGRYGLGYHAACANDPMVGGYCIPSGDPGMAIVPPVEQFRSDLVFLTPDDYAEDFAVLIAPRGATVQLDGMPLRGFTTVGDVQGTSYATLRLQLDSDGSHHVTSDMPVGLLVEGIDAYVSYSYVAGLNVDQINLQ